MEPNVTIPLDVLTHSEVKRLHKRMFERLRREMPNSTITINAVNLLRKELHKRKL